jgi:tetratricopeptide (TPR) repeat protein
MSRKRSRAHKTATVASSASDAASSSPRGAFLVAIGLAVLVLLAYSNTFECGFVFDNAFVLLKDPRLRAFTWDNVRAIFGREYWGAGDHSGLYRPFTTLTYALDYAVLGHAARPAGYHAFNLLLHWLNAVLVFALSRRIIGEERAAAVVAALFAVHPLATEAVTNIVGRADLLAALFVLGALLLHERSQDAVLRTRGLALCGMGAAAALGVLSKENAVVLPALMLLGDVVRRRGRWRERAPGYVVTMGAIASVMVLRRFVMSGLTDAAQNVTDNPLVLAGFWTGRLTAVKVLGYYLVRFFWPSRLSADYSFDQIPLFTGGLRGDDLHAWLALGACAALVAGLVWAWRRRPALAGFLGFFLIALLPVSNVLFSIGTIMAERLMYLPSVGLCGATVVIGGACVAAATSGARVRQEHVHRAATALAALAIVALGARTFVRNRDWRDDLSLWTAAEEASPRSYKVHLGRSLALTMKPGAASTDEVIEIAERGRAILESRGLPLPYRPLSVYHNLGVSYLKQGLERRRAGREAAARESYEKAAEVLTAAIAIEKTLTLSTAAERARHALLLAMADNALGRADDALLQLQEPLAVTPDDPGVYVARARALRLQQRFEDAAVSVDTAILLGADDPDLWSLAREVYDRLSPQAPALVVDEGRTMLARDHPLVRAHLLKAGRELMRALTAAGRGADARQLRDRMVAAMDLEPSSFDESPGERRP